MRASAQRAWDTAAALAAAGRDRPSVVADVLDVVSRDIDDEVARQVPRRGRVFLLAVAQALAWGVLADVLLLLVGSTGWRSIPWLTTALCVVVLLWSLGFGVVAGRNRVHGRRIRVSHAQQEMFRRIASGACLQVWASQVPGRWQPCGPEPDAGRPVQSAGRAWLDRFGDEFADVAVTVASGSANRLAPVLAVPGPVAVFVPDGADVDPSAVALAESAGAGIFLVRGARLEPGTTAARDVLAAYRSAANTRPPVGILHDAWRSAHAGR
ncbi:hypothetical protein [Nakamurella endophytica]|uniref:Uncharacterized protein n=1 Tax=Nakamurella endophytica TaxID=1748367 RepID=A0A917SS26_9ACTN|nr:hypothetical protein [Nakamurella endophytica]GGL93456.1 hypothetical protein GCM10011594_11640 [Nakamurella endophytica]